MSLRKRTQQVQYRAGQEELSRQHAADYLDGVRSRWWMSRRDMLAVKRLQRERERARGNGPQQ